MLDKLNKLSQSSGELRPGRGLGSGVVAKTYAAHFAFIDHLFGTAVQSDRAWPARYGVVGDYVPQGFWRQLLFPFAWKGS